MNDYYKSEDEIEAVVSGFESCTTGKGDFSHQSHLTVAVSYLRELAFEEALEKMRGGLLSFLNHHGIGHEKYNETLTVFWLKTTRDHMAALAANLSRLELTNAVIDSLTDSRLAMEYYSRERLWSDEAREAWVEPDLKAQEKHS